jgi:threonine dehydratase
MTTFDSTSRADRIAGSDEDVARAMRAAFEHVKIIAEPGGAVALAAVVAGRIETAGRQIGVIASAGNVDAEKFCRLLN